MRVILPLAELVQRIHVWALMWIQLAFAVARSADRDRLDWPGFELVIVPPWWHPEIQHQATVPE